MLILRSVFFSTADNIRWRIDAGIKMPNEVKLPSRRKSKKPKKPNDHPVNHLKPGAPLVLMSEEEFKARLTKAYQEGLDNHLTDLALASE